MVAMTEEEWEELANTAAAEEVYEDTDEDAPDPNEPGEDDPMFAALAHAVAGEGEADEDEEAGDVPEAEAVSWWDDVGNWFDTGSADPAVAETAPADGGETAAPKAAKDMSTDELLKQFMSGNATPATTPMPPEQKDAVKQELIRKGYGEPQIDYIMKTLDTTEGQKLALTIMGKPPVVPKASTKKTPEEYAAQRKMLQAGYPDPASQAVITATPDEGLANLSSILARRLLHPPKVTAPKTPAINRAEVYRRFPWLEGYGPGLTDASISSILTKVLGEQRTAEAQGGVTYTAKKGAPRVRISRKSIRDGGYKSGDTVCVRIP